MLGGRRLLLNFEPATETRKKLYWNINTNIFIKTNSLYSVCTMAPNCKIINFTADSSDWVRELLLEGEERQREDGDRVWNITTKYYKAKVIIHQVDCREILDDTQENKQMTDFEDTEAVVFHCDTSKVCLGKLQRISFFQSWKSLGPSQPS